MKVRRSRATEAGVPATGAAPSAHRQGRLWYRSLVDAPGAYRQGRLWYRSSVDAPGAYRQGCLWYLATGAAPSAHRQGRLWYRFGIWSLELGV